MFCIEMETTAELDDLFHIETETTAELDDIDSQNSKQYSTFRKHFHIPSKWKDDENFQFLLSYEYCTTNVRSYCKSGKGWSLLR